MNTSAKRHMVIRNFWWDPPFLSWWMSIAGINVVSNYFVIAAYFDSNGQDTIFFLFFFVCKRCFIMTLIYVQCMYICQKIYNMLKINCVQNLSSETLNVSNEPLSQMRSMAEYIGRSVKYSFKMYWIYKFTLLAVLPNAQQIFIEIKENYGLSSSIRIRMNEYGKFLHFC